MVPQAQQRGWRLPLSDAPLLSLAHRRRRRSRCTAGLFSTTQTLIPWRSGTIPSHYYEWKLLSQHWPYHRRHQETRRGRSARAPNLRRRETCRLGHLQNMEHAVTVSRWYFVISSLGGQCAGCFGVLFLRICTVAAAHGRGSAGRDNGPGRGCDHRFGAAKRGRLAAPKAKADTAFLLGVLFWSVVCFFSGAGQCDPPSQILAFFVVFCVMHGVCGGRVRDFSPTTFKKPKGKKRPLKAVLSPFWVFISTLKLFRGSGLTRYL